jgi:ABC-type multidrug transport system fused ATPase/permease subunit
VAALVLGGLAATALAAVPPLLLAPIMYRALGGAEPAAPPPAGLSGLSLRNLGAALLAWAGVGAGADRLTVIAVLCAAWVAVGFVKGWADFGNYLLALWIRVRAHAALQADLFRHLLGLSMGFFTRQRSGELASRLTTDTHAAIAGLELIAGTLLTAPLLIAFYGFLLVRTSPVLVVAALAAALLHYGITRLIRGPIRRLASDQFSVLAEVAQRFHEAILSVRVVKSFGAEAFEAARAARALRDLVRVNVKFGVYKHVEEPARTVVAHVVEAGILLLAIRELLAGRLAAPTFFLLLYVGRAALVQVAQLASAYTQMQATLAASGRVAALLATTPGVRDGAEDIDGFRDRIALRDVDFGYPAARWWRWWGRAAPASPPWPTSSCASTTRTAGRSPSTAATCARCARRPTAASSAWCPRRRSCSTAPCARTSPTDGMR